MASHLDKSLQEVQLQTTSFEFVLWMAWLKKKREDEIERHTKQDYYMAALTAEVRRSWVKHPNRVKADQFLMTFKLEAKAKKPKVESPDMRLQKSKAFWAALLNPKRGKK